MGKRSLWVTLAILVTMLLCGNAAATPFVWTDVYSKSELLNKSNPDVHYTHIINDLWSGSFDPGVDFVSRYTLKITLEDDASDDGCEIAYINQPGLSGDGFFTYTSPYFGWSILGRLSLNETGSLAIDIFRVFGDFIFVSSELNAYGYKGEPLAVSEPGAMMILGFGLFGLAGCARRRFKI